jgi:hypothetical protein
MSSLTQPKNSTRVSKRELEQQIQALQLEVDELNDKFNITDGRPTGGGSIADELIASKVEQRVNSALSGGFGEVSPGFIGVPPVSRTGGVEPKSFNGLLADIPDHPSLGISSSNLLDIPAGASTLLSQLARAQRIIQDVTAERDELKEKLADARDAGRPRSLSPHSTEALAKMHELYGR